MLILMIPLANGKRLTYPLQALCMRNQPHPRLETPTQPLNTVKQVSSPNTYVRKKESRAGHLGNGPPAKSRP